MPADPALFDELLSFVMSRAKERKNRAEAQRAWEARRRADSEIKLIVELAADVRQHPWAMAEGIEWLRTRAVRDKDHRDYDPIWTPPAET